MKTQRYKDNKVLTIDDMFPARTDNCCRYCDTPLTGKQTKWCSKSCSLKAFDETMFARGSSKHVRERVFARDNGICANCGVDCEKIQRISDAAWRALLDYEDDAFNKTGWNRYVWCIGNIHGWGGDSAMSIHDKQYFKACRKIVGHTPLNYGLSCWQADHILEVVNGGTHTMENLQTLCNSCHKAKTKTLYKKQ